MARQGTLRGSITQNFIASRRRRTKGGYGVLFRLGVLVGALALVIGAVIWLWHINWPQRQFERLVDAAINVSKEAGFAVTDIAVEGRKHTDKSDLAEALGVTTGAPILSFDPETALNKIEKLPWINGATVVRKLPNTIYIKLIEREPLARWQREGKVVVIDREGKELPGAKPEKFSSLPLVMGEDAPGETAEFLTALKDFPAIKNLMEAAVRVSDRRWNLHLQPKLLVKLPEHNISGALQRLSQLIREQKILERSIVAVDLRLPDRMFLERAESVTPKEVKK